MTKIFCDIADINLIKKFNKKHIVKGFTTNPSLMRLSKAKNYKKYSLELLRVCTQKPISLEVFTDKFNQMLQDVRINGLKGHRSVGGYRASMYNALPLESVKVLVDVMQDLEKHHGN